MTPQRPSLFGVSRPASAHPASPHPQLTKSPLKASSKTTVLPDGPLESISRTYAIFGSKPSRLKQLPFSTSMGLSVFSHASAPLLTYLLWSLLVFILLFLFNLDLNRFFAPPQAKTPDIEFVLVRDIKAKAPKNAKFKGEYNQTAGGAKTAKDPAPFETPTEVAAKNPAQKPSPQQTSPAPSPKPTPARQPSPPRKQLVQKAQPQPQKQPNKPEPPKPKLAKQPPTLGKPAIKMPAPPKPPSPQVAQRQTTDQAINQSPSPAISPQAATTGPSSQFQSASQALASAGTPGLSPNLSRGAAQKGPSKSAGVDVQASPDFGPYMAELKRRLARNWKPPRGRDSRRVVIRFDVLRSGELGKLSVEQSSGIASSDEAAMTAVRISAPFKPLPPSFSEESIPILFTFDYTIYGLGNR